MDVDDSVMDVIREMAKIPAALKAWRAPISDLLNDNRLFNCNAEAAMKWKPIVKALFDADKTASPELLGSVAAVSLSRFLTYLHLSSEDRDRSFYPYLHQQRV
jgi:hypothetical protein